MYNTFVKLNLINYFVYYCFFFCIWKSKEVIIWRKKTKYRHVGTILKIETKKNQSDIGDLNDTAVI